MKLAAMWAVGQTYFPEAGEYYAQLSRELGGTDNQGAAFNRYGAIPGTPVSGTFPGRVFPVWEQVRDLLQKILAESAQNLYDTGATVMHVADLFAAEDREGAREIDVAAAYNEEKLRYQKDPLDRVPDQASRQQPQQPT
jgi:hypothetical protein